MTKELTLNEVGAVSGGYKTVILSFCHTTTKVADGGSGWTYQETTCSSFNAPPGWGGPSCPGGLST